MGLEKYKSVHGKSGVTHYEISDTAITVIFKDTAYRYSYVRPGRHHVEIMKELARQGYGLSTYISRNINDDYELKYP